MQERYELVEHLVRAAAQREAAEKAWLEAINAALEAGVSSALVAEKATSDPDEMLGIAQAAATRTRYTGT